jgi:hypothetical protein
MNGCENDSTQDAFMLNRLIQHVASSAGLSIPQARQALGVVLNAGERQGSALADLICREVPGARTLAAETGADFGAATGAIARLIEQTPGGRRLVFETMVMRLHAAGLGHDQVSALLPALGSYARSVLGVEMAGDLGDAFGAGATPGEALRRVA